MLRDVEFKLVGFMPVLQLDLFGARKPPLQLRGSLARFLSEMLGKNVLLSPGFQFQLIFEREASLPFVDGFTHDLSQRRRRRKSSIAGSFDGLVKGILVVLLAALPFRGLLASGDSRVPCSVAGIKRSCAFHGAGLVPLLHGL